MGIKFLMELKCETLGTFPKNICIFTNRTEERAGS